MKSKTFDLHTIAAAAISVLGTAVVYLPSVNDKSPILAMIFALLIGLPLYMLFVQIVGRIDLKNNIIKKGLGILLSLFLIYLAAESFHAVSDYFSASVLPKTPTWLIMTALFLLVLYAVVCGGDAVKKFTVIGFLAIAILLIILIAVSFKNLNISLISSPRFNLPFFETVAKYLVVIFVASAEALVFQRKGGNQKSFLKSTVLGIAIGGAFLTLVIANSVLVFGEGYAAEIEFPYTSAVSTFSVGTLFTRLDGFAYFIILTVNFLKGALCILSCEYLLSPFKIKRRKLILFILCVLSFLISMVV